jgi:RNA polymerase sigma-70 factor (ECF subfamily)
MPAIPADNIQKSLESIYRAESRRVLATLIRLLGDFDAAEEAMHEAFTAAAEQWPKEGVPANPRAWLVSAGKFKAIDSIRRQARFDHSLDSVSENSAADTKDPAERIDDVVEDDSLRLIFTCCHPAHSARADLYRRLGMKEEARDAYECALAMTKQEPEQRFLERRLAGLTA